MITKKTIYPYIADENTARRLYDACYEMAYRAKSRFMPLFESHFRYLWKKYIFTNNFSCDFYGDFDVILRNINIPNELMRKRDFFYCFYVAVFNTIISRNKDLLKLHNVIVCEDFNRFEVISVFGYYPIVKINPDCYWAFLLGKYDDFFHEVYDHVSHYSVRGINEPVDNFEFDTELVGDKICQEDNFEINKDFLCKFIEKNNFTFEEIKYINNFLDKNHD